MKKILVLLVVIALAITSIAACSEQPPTHQAADGKQDSSEATSKRVSYELIENTEELHPKLQEIIEQAKTQKGYLVIKGSDLPEPDTTLIFIGSGEKNTGGYGIEVQTVEETKNVLNIVVKETAPGKNSMVITAITYPFVVVQVKGNFTNCKVVDTEGNEFKPVKVRGPEPVSDKNANESPEGDTTAYRKGADELMDLFVSSINANDVQGILRCLDPRLEGYYTKETIQATLEDLKVCLKDGKITSFEWVSEHPHMPQAYIYRLVSDSGATKEVNVVFQNGIASINSELLTYSYKAKHLLKAFIHALQREDEKLLADVLTEDDLVYPVSNVSKIIENYKKHFDLQTLKYQFIGVESEENCFVYKIIGTKNGKNEEHLINIAYGDMLVGIRDKWVPPRP